jgi:cytochrome c553
MPGATLNYFKEGVRGTAEGDTTGAMMRPMAMILADDAAVRNVSAYLASLDLPPPNPTIVNANIRNGERIYTRNCAACHLPDASGTWYTDAPRLAGMSDWYFVHQIEKFNDKIRGDHRGDDYGEQMVSMATAMANRQEIEDVAAYISTLQ